MFSRLGLTTLLTSSGFEGVTIRSAPHIQTAVSIQNTLVARGWNPEMRFGKTPIYGALLIGVLPFEALAYIADQGGIIDFVARKPSW